MRLYRTVEPLVLASESPRRRELLRSVGLDFEVVPSGVEEKGDPAQTPEHLVEWWAAQKARSVAAHRQDCWVLGSDTIVVLEGRIFGKPSDRAEALSMLNQLNGRDHEVISAVTLVHQGVGFFRALSVRTQVRFKEATEAEIRAYVRTGEPFDKAGAYGIQGMGVFLVRSIIGSYTNVVGLPLCETLGLLLEKGVIAPAL
jgi:septum formation protein